MQRVILGSVNFCWCIRCIGNYCRSVRILEMGTFFFSPDSKQAVIRILDQVNELSTAEKLLLYLKLPTGRSGKVDPLRQ